MEELQATFKTTLEENYFQGGIYISQIFSLSVCLSIFLSLSLLCISIYFHLFSVHCSIALRKRGRVWMNDTMSCNSKQHQISLQSWQNLTLSALHFKPEKLQSVIHEIRSEFVKCINNSIHAVIGDNQRMFVRFSQGEGLRAPQNIQDRECLWLWYNSLEPTVFIIFLEKEGRMED